MSMPPMDSAEPRLWMTVIDVFHIQGRGTVISGRLEGLGLLNVGDWMQCDGQRWQVAGISQLHQQLTTAGPGPNIGVILKKGPAPDDLRGKTFLVEQSARWTAVAPKKRRWRP